MKVLLDECVDWRLAHDIPGHSVRTDRQMGWTAIKNGELLRLADLRPLVPKLLAAIERAQPGIAEFIGAD